MKKSSICLLAFLYCFSTILVVAQTPTTVPTGYTVYDYIKVAPNMRDDYLKLEKAFKKIHLAKQKAGKLDGWSFSQVVSPVGASCEYNFVTRNRFKDDAQLANLYEGTYMPDNWQSLLTAEELSLVNKVNEIRTIVKEEVYSSVDEVTGPDMSKAKFVVVNFIGSPTGKSRADHYKIEKDIWKPVHAARVKDGKMKGWLVMDLNTPFGSEMPYNSIAIDVYTDMKEYLAIWFDEYFKKVHPTKDVNDLMKQTRENTNLVKGELRVVIDRLEW
jgi:hypothetical protein